MSLIKPFEGIEREVALTREFMQASERRYQALAEASEQRYQEQLQITREVIRRNEIAFNDARRETNEMLKERRAHRGALLAVLDRLGGGPADPPS